MRRVVERPWEFSYDADLDGEAYKTVEASILGPQGELIVEEPGPEADWRDLEHIVECVNSHEALKAQRDALLEAAKEAVSGFSGDDVRLLAVAVGGVLPDKIHEKCDRMLAANESLRAAIRLAEGGQE